jgi:hypothetical protein
VAILSSRNLRVMNSALASTAAVGGTKDD